MSNTFSSWFSSSSSSSSSWFSSSSSSSSSWFSSPPPPSSSWFSSSPPPQKPGVLSSLWSVGSTIASGSVELAKNEKVQKGAIIAAGATVGVGVIPAVLAAAGFGAGGIAAGSTGAVLMSKGVVGVSLAQSVGAAGLATGTKVALGTTGGFFANWLWGSAENKS